MSATGGIFSVVFSGEFSKNLNKPAENLKWGESLESVKKKYGEPLKIYLDSNRATHIYKNFELVYFVNKLRWINFSRDITESEIAAEQTFNREKLEAERIANTPENRLIKLYAEQKKLERELENYADRINELIKKHNELMTTQGNTNLTKSYKFNANKLKFEALALIDTFLYKYGDQLSSVSPEAKAKILQSRKNFGGDIL